MFRCCLKTESAHSDFAPKSDSPIHRFSSNPASDRKLEVAFVEKDYDSVWMKDVLSLVASWYSKWPLDVTTHPGSAGPDFIGSVVTARQNEWLIPYVGQDYQRIAGIAGLGRDLITGYLDRGDAWAFSDLVGGDVLLTAIVIAHEAGHQYGLEHNDIPNSIMNPIVGKNNINWTEEDKRRLSAAIQTDTTLPIGSQVVVAGGSFTGIYSVWRGIQVAKMPAADDVSTAPGIIGLSRGPWVEIYLNDSYQSPFTGWQPFDNYRGRLNIAVSRKQEGFLVVVAPDEGGSPHLKVFEVSANGLQWSLKAQWMAYEPSMRAGCRIAIDGDKIFTIPGVGGAPLLKVWTLDGKNTNAWWAYDNQLRNGFSLGAWNGEVITFPQKGSAHVKIWNSRGETKQEWIQGTGQGVNFLDGGGVTIGTIKHYPGWFGHSGGKWAVQVGEGTMDPYPLKNPRRTPMVCGQDNSGKNDWIIHVPIGSRRVAMIQ